MARTYCKGCDKPINMCICALFLAIDNNIKLVVLQHPKEVGHSKGSLPLLTHSLNDVECYVGEDFNTQSDLIQRISLANSYLLYPESPAEAKTAASYNAQMPAANIECIVVIDASWKKSYRMYQINPWLHQLPKFVLSDIEQGQYAIRTTSKLNGLSTLEASCYALAQSDLKNAPHYLQLITNFAQFNQQWLAQKQRNMINE